MCAGAKPTRLEAGSQVPYRGYGRLVLTATDNLCRVGLVIMLEELGRPPNEWKQALALDTNG